MRAHRWIACSALGLAGCCIPLPLGDDGGDEPDPASPLHDPTATLTPLPRADAPASGASGAPVAPAQGTTVGRGSMSALARGEVPQVQNRFELFHDAPRIDGAEIVEDGLILCDLRVSTESDADTFKGPDTSMRLRIGRGPIRTARGPEDSWGAVLSMPVSRLERGDTVWMRVIDRDVWHDEIVGDDSLTYRGRFPLRFRSDDLRVECRMLDERQVEARVGRPLSLARQSIHRLDRDLTPDVRVPGLGYPELDRLRVARDLSAAAAWVDWDDPRVSALVVEMDRLDATWRSRAAGAIARETERLPAPGADVPLGPGYEGSVREVRCGMEADRLVSRHPELHARAPTAPCFAKVGMRRVDGRTQVFGPLEPEPFVARVLTGAGSSLGAPVVAREDGASVVSVHAPGQVAAGDTVHFWVALPVSTEAADGARLLWLRPAHAATTRGWVARLR